MKKVLGVYGNPNQHWVGNGFPVRTIFSYDTLGSTRAPSCCSIMPGRGGSILPPGGAASASTRTAASRR